MLYKLYPVLLSSLFIIGCGSDSSNTGDVESCTRYSGSETTYYYPHTGRTNRDSFTVTSRDSNSYWLTGVSEYDAYDDGSIDEIEHYSYLSRDAFGNLIVYSRDRDIQADGSIDWVYINTYTRNSHGDRVFRNTEIDTSSDDIFDLNRKYYYITDSHSHDFFEKIEYDYNYDGSIDAKYTFAYSYDSAGRFLSSIRSYDSNNDGIIDSTRTENYTFLYNSDGSEIGRVFSYDEDQDGTTDKIQTETYLYEEYECEDASL